MTDYDIQSLPSYLASTGMWTRERADDRREVWRHSRGATVFVPLVKGSDYLGLTQLATSRVAESEDRLFEDVEIDLTFMEFDKMHVRRETTRPGLRFDDGLEFHAAVRDAVLAAAQAFRSPQATYGSRRPSMVDDFLGRVRLIPSLQGSFVVRALLPVEPHSEQLQLPLTAAQATNVPRVSSTILSASAAAVDTARLVAGGEDPEIWSTAVEHGVSANLCDALSRLPAADGNSGDADISVRWTWAAPHAPSPTIRVNQGLAPVLAAGSDYLRSAEEMQTLTAVGTVVGLHRQERNGPGDVTVKGHVDGWDARARSLRFELEENLYHEAVIAHDEGHTVAVHVDVVRQARKPFEVQRVRSFRTVTN